MKRQLIALRGRGGIGKSSALHALYRLLVSDPINPANPVVKPLSFEAIGIKLDFIAIVKIERYKVGLVNRGDIPAGLKVLLDDLVLNGCDVIVCAARSKGPAFRRLLTSYSPRYPLVEVKKEPSNRASHPVSNLRYAHELATLVYAAIDA